MNSNVTPAPPEGQEPIEQLFRDVFGLAEETARRTTAAEVEERLDQLLRETGHEEARHVSKQDKTEAEAVANGTGRSVAVHATGADRESLEANIFAEARKFFGPDAPLKHGPYQAAKSVRLDAPEDQLYYADVVVFEQRAVSALEAAEQEARQVLTDLLEMARELHYPPEDQNPRYTSGQASLILAFTGLYDSEYRALVEAAITYRMPVAETVSEIFARLSASGRTS